MISAKNADR